MKDKCYWLVQLKYKQKCNNFGYLSIQVWLKGNDNGLASSNLKMTIYDGIMMMTRCPTSFWILNDNDDDVRWHRTNANNTRGIFRGFKEHFGLFICNLAPCETSLKKRQRHDDLAITVNDAAPCTKPPSAVLKTGLDQFCLFLAV